MPAPMIVLVRLRTEERTEPVRSPPRRAASIHDSLCGSVSHDVSGGWTGAGGWTAAGAVARHDASERRLGDPAAVSLPSAEEARASVDIAARKQRRQLHRLFEGGTSQRWTL